MAREKDRKLRRRRQRRTKLHKLKARLAQSKGMKEREHLIEKIIKISVYPPEDIPKE